MTTAVRPPSRPAGLPATWRSWIPAVALWAIPVVLLAVVVPVAAAVESGASSSPPPSSVVVGHRARDLRMSVTATVDVRADVTARAGIAGVVTAIRVEPGDEVTQGTRLLDVDGVGVVAQLGGFPLFRAIGPGSKGADVAELHSFLAGLGVAPTASGTVYTRATAASVKAFQTSLGASADGVFRPEYVAYLPADPGPVESVDVVVGDRVDAGDATVGFPLALTAATLTPVDSSQSLHVFADAPTRLIAGDRELDLASSRPAADELTSLAAFVAAGVSDGSLTITTEGDRRVVTGLLLALRDPIDVGTVPGEAVYSAADGSACVFVLGADGPTATPVDRSLVASTELGVADVDPGLAGRTVAALASALPMEVLAGCG